MEISLLERAVSISRDLGLASDADLDRLVEAPPADADPAALKRLRQIAEAGGWVLVESGLADLPADLRWLYESGAVTLEQLAAAHAIAGIIPEDHLTDDYIVPSVFDKRVVRAVAQAVAKAARDTGVARRR